MLFVTEHWSNRQAVTAVPAGKIWKRRYPSSGFERENNRVIGKVFVQRRSPVATIIPRISDVLITAVACSGQENIILLIILVLELIP